MAKADSRAAISIECIECKSRNYSTSKNKKNDAGRIELKKFCPACGSQTIHRETR